MKIRYIERYSKTDDVVDEDYKLYIQEKTWLGWKSLGYTINLGYASIWQEYTSNSKEELLKEVLHSRKKSLEYVNIIEYPTLKEY